MPAIVPAIRRNSCLVPSIPPSGGTAGQAAVPISDYIALHYKLAEGRKRTRTSGQLLYIFVTVLYSCISNTETGLLKEQPVNGNRILQRLVVACIPNGGLSFPELRFLQAATCIIH